MTNRQIAETNKENVEESRGKVRGLMTPPERVLFWQQLFLDLSTVMHTIRIHDNSTNKPK